MTVLMATLAERNPRTAPGNHVHDVWLAQIKTPVGIISAYIKEEVPRRIAAEAFCALLARRLGLNVPQPYLVLVPAGMIRGKGSFLAFGLEEAGGNTLHQIITDNNSPQLKQAMRAWDKLHDATAFDEWVGNSDRHNGNVLYDGKEFTLIDHSHSFDASNDARNQLFEKVTYFGDLDVEKLIRATPDIELKHAGVNLVDVRAGVARAASKNNADILMKFLTDRIGSIRDRLDARRGNRRLL